MAKRKSENISKNINHLESQPEYVPHLIFINQADTFNNKVIASNLIKELFKNFNREGLGDVEEEEQEEEEEESSSDRSESFLPRSFTHKPKPPPKQYWKLYGTVSSSKITQIESLTKIIDFTANKEFMDEIYKCGVFIIDITQDPDEITLANFLLDQILLRLDSEFNESEKQFNQRTQLRFFILISTTMTWALTKPISREDPTVPFNESDYRKRKPHPNYKPHIDIEKKVVKYGKKYPERLQTVVLASGITYGYEECDLAVLFEYAWLNDPQQLPIFGTGSNTIPLIHVKDLACLITQLLTKLPNKQYILAVEQMPAKLRQIVKTLSHTMGTGQIKKIPQEEGFLYPEITQEMYERWTVNLIMEPEFIMNEVEMKWQSELNLPQNMIAICYEYKTAKKLAPIRIILHGPPAVGKTLLAKRLCDKYKLTYLHVGTVITETIADLKTKIDDLKKQAAKEQPEDLSEEGVEEEELTEDEEEPNIDDYANQLDDIQKALKTGRLPMELVTRLVKQKMYSNRLLNQGWVLDGYPKTLEEAQDLFGLGEGDDDDDLEHDGEVQETEVRVNKQTMAQFVFSLEATDEFLCDRTMRLPGMEVQNTHYVEEHMLRRLEAFRNINTGDDTVLNFYDENEVHPEILDTMIDTDPNMELTFNKICESIGKPRNLGPSKAILAKMEQLAEIEALKAKEAAEKELKLREEQMQQEYLSKMEHWSDMMLQLQKEEAELLAVQGEPLRNYLMKYVFPTLTKGLLEVARVKPEDPIDYLAEYLFKENPEGKMFDPAYTAVAGEFMDAIQTLQDAIGGTMDELATLRQNIEFRKTGGGKKCEPYSEPCDK